MGSIRRELPTPPLRRLLRFRNRKQSRVEYNSRGRVTRFTDPVGRETIYDYATNEIDFLSIKQKNGASHEIVKEMTYNSAHRPLTLTDASAKTNVFTYSTEGQLQTVTTPQRAGIVENRTTTYEYDEDGYLEDVTGPATDATTSYSYGQLRKDEYDHR